MSPHPPQTVIEAVHPTMDETMGVMKTIAHAMVGPSLIIIGLVLFTGIFAGMMSLLHMVRQAKEREHREHLDNEMWARERAVSNVVKPSLHAADNS